MKATAQRVTAILMLLVCWLLPVSAVGTSAEQPLQGVTESRAVFDFKVATAEDLLFYLEVIAGTRQGLLEQGQQPLLVVAFRGPVVRLITTETWSLAEEDLPVLAQAHARIKELREGGVRFEACSVAMAHFRVDPATLFPEVEAVSNTFISLIDYQARDYSLVVVK